MKASQKGVVEDEFHALIYTWSKSGWACLQYPEGGCHMIGQICLRPWFVHVVPMQGNTRKSLTSNR